MRPAKRLLAREKRGVLREGTAMIGGKGWSRGHLERQQNLVIDWFLGTLIAWDPVQKSYRWGN